MKLELENYIILLNVIHVLRKSINFLKNYGLFDDFVDAIRKMTCIRVGSAVVRNLLFEQGKGNQYYGSNLEKYKKNLGVYNNINMGNYEKKIYDF